MSCFIALSDIATWQCNHIHVLVLEILWKARGVVTCDNIVPSNLTLKNAHCVLVDRHQFTPVLNLWLTSSQKWGDMEFLFAAYEWSCIAQIAPIYYPPTKRELAWFEKAQTNLKWCLIAKKTSTQKKKQNLTYFLNLKTHFSLTYLVTQSATTFTNPFIHLIRPPKKPLNDVHAKSQ